MRLLDYMVRFVRRKSFAFSFGRTFSESHLPCSKAFNPFNRLRTKLAQTENDYNNKYYKKFFYIK